MARPKLYGDLHGLWFQMGLERPSLDLVGQYEEAFALALKFTEERLGRRLGVEEFHGLLDLDYGRWLQAEREIK